MSPSKRHSDEPREESVSAEVTPEMVLAHLATLSQPASIRQIAHGMELRHRGRRYLPRVLQKLKKRGEVEETHGGQFRLAGTKHARNEASGRAAATKRASAANAHATDAAAGKDGGAVSCSASGCIGRCVPRAGEIRIWWPDESWRIATVTLFWCRMRRSLAWMAICSSDATAWATRCTAITCSRGSCGGAPTAARKGEWCRLSSASIPLWSDLFRYGPHGNVVLPYDTRILHEVIIPSGAELTPSLREKLGVVPGGPAPVSSRTRLPELDGAVVNVEITRFPKGGLAPTGRVIEILGRPGEIGVDVEIIIRKHHLPHIFPDEVQAEARATQQKVTDADIAGRRDFRHLPIVTIDGETARDFDDAVYVAALPNGHYELQVHIADVAHYVKRGSPLDREARLRGTSVYFPNRAVPMLPEELSNGICSLNPKVDRLVMSAVLELDGAAKLLHAEFLPGRDPFGGAHDVHERQQSDRGRSGNERTLRAAGERVPEDEGTGALAEQAAACAWLH